MLDTAGSARPRRFKVLLVWADVVHDIISGAIVDLVKGMLKSTQRAIGG